MSRIRKIMVVISTVLAVTAIQVPASAHSSAETCRYEVEIAGQKYGWNAPICL